MSAACPPTSVCPQDDGPASNRTERQGCEEGPRCRLAVEERHCWPREPGSQMRADAAAARATPTWVPSRTASTALRARETPSAPAATQRGRDPFHSPSPRFRGTSHPCEPKKVQRYMLPPGRSVASRITHHRSTDSTVLLSQRRRLVNEAEEDIRHIRFFHFGSALRATLSSCPLRIQQSSQDCIPVDVSS